MYEDFVFGKDVFLRTDHPVALDSEDAWSPSDEMDLYHGKPLSFICDFNSGEDLAANLLKLYPGKTRLLDLGTATGSVPLTMRRSGMQALGIDGLDAGKRGEIQSHMIAGSHPSCGPEAVPRASRFAWALAPELVDCCDVTYPFRFEDAVGQSVKFDYIVSTDCFEHLVTNRIPALVDNIYENLADDGFGIFEICVGAFVHLHQTVRPDEWWKEMFSRRFVIDEERSAMDFRYVRSQVRGGKICFLDHFGGEEDKSKSLFWVRKRP